MPGQSKKQRKHWSRSHKDVSRKTMPETDGYVRRNHAKQIGERTLQCVTVSSDDGILPNGEFAMVQCHADIHQPRS
jgi:hypothetical protein